MNNVKQSSDPAIDRCRHVTLSPETFAAAIELLTDVCELAEAHGWLPQHRRAAADLLRILRGAAGPNAHGKLRNQLEAAVQRADLLAARVRVLNRELDRVRKENARLRAEDRLLKVVPEFILNPKGPVG